MTLQMIFFFVVFSSLQYSLNYNNAYWGKQKAKAFMGNNSDNNTTYVYDQLNLKINL